MTWPDPNAGARDQMVKSSAQGVGLWRHSGNRGMNINFADGHVEARSKESIPVDSGDTDNGYFWASSAGN